MFHRPAPTKSDPRQWRAGSSRKTIRNNSFFTWIRAGGCESVGVFCVWGDMEGSLGWNMGGEERGERSNSIIENLLALSRCQIMYLLVLKRYYLLHWDQGIRGASSTCYVLSYQTYCQEGDFSGDALDFVWFECGIPAMGRSTHTMRYLTPRPLSNYWRGGS